jgi:transcriptional adapter 2-alpha
MLLPTSKYTNPQTSSSLTTLLKSQPVTPSLGSKFSSSLSSAVDSDQSTPIPNGIVNGHSSVSSKLRKPTVNPLDISHAADVELLSPQEQVLCSQLRIMPKPYLAIKESLFRELLKSGGVLKKKTARELIKIDVNKTARIYEFFQSQHWIPSTS